MAYKFPKYMPIAVFVHVVWLTHADAKVGLYIYSKCIKDILQFLIKHTKIRRKYYRENLATFMLISEKNKVK